MSEQDVFDRIEQLVHHEQDLRGRAVGDGQGTTASGGAGAWISAGICCDSGERRASSAKTPRTPRPAPPVKCSRTSSKFLRRVPRQARLVYEDIGSSP